MENLSLRNLIKDGRGRPSLIRSTPSAISASHFLPHRPCYRQTLLHQCLELREIQRLIAVAESLLGIGMDFQNESVGTGGDGGAAMSGTRYVWPVPWLGSTTIGKCVL